MLPLFQRPLPFKVGFALQFVGAAFYVTGLVSPFYLRQREREGVWSDHGVWDKDLVMCLDEKPIADCRVFLPDKDLLQKAFILNCVGAVLMVHAIAYGCAVNLTRRDIVYRDYWMERLIVVGSVLGFAALLMYVRQTYYGYNVQYNWAFWLQSIAAIAVYIGAVLTSMYNDPPKRTILEV